MDLVLLLLAILYLLGSDVGTALAVAAIAEVILVTIAAYLRDKRDK